MNYNLKRFVDAQEADYTTALSEIKSGRKLSHWIWYVFPQLKGLGFSYNSNYYGIDDVEEAKAYFRHPLLGKRLVEITCTLLSLPESYTALNVLGPIDSLKVKSCMTLFDYIVPHDCFEDVLNRFYGGKRDKRTLNLIEKNLDI